MIPGSITVQSKSFCHNAEEEEGVFANELFILQCRCCIVLMTLDLRRNIFPLLLSISVEYIIWCIVR